MLEPLKLESMLVGLATFFSAYLPSVMIATRPKGGTVYTEIVARQLICCKENGFPSGDWLLWW